MNKVLVVLVAVVGVSVLVLIASYAMSAMKSNDSSGSLGDSTKQISKDNFELTYKYTDENKWTYTVKGELPNPCYMVTTDALVMESYPEQVSVQLKVVEPDVDMVCAQVVTPYEYNGEVSASMGASFGLVVEMK